MKDLFRRVLALSIILTTLTSFTTVNAYQMSNFKNSMDIEKSIDIKVDKVTLTTTDYQEEEVNLITKYDNHSTTTLIFDKVTGTLLEKIEETSLPIAGRSSGTYHTQLRRTRYDGPVETVLEMAVEIYHYNSFRQINKINATKMFIFNSSNSTLNDVTAYSSSSTGKFPTVSLNFGGSGVITQATTSSITGSASISALESANFSLSHSVGNTRYYRKYITMNGTYTI